MVIKKNKLAPSLREYFNFRICDDCIEWNGKQVFFLRIHPKNMSILSYDEKLTEIKKFQNFLNAAACRFSVFITDKTENLDDISRYYNRQLESRPEYAFILEPIIERISSIEQSSACIQRAFYIVFRAKDQREYDIFAKQLSGRLEFSLAKKEELILVMRNYILREYTPFDLYVFEDAVKKRYDEHNKKVRQSRKVTINPYREDREDNIAVIEKISAAAQEPAVKGDGSIYEQAEDKEIASNTTRSLWPHG